MPTPSPTFSRYEKFPPGAVNLELGVPKAMFVTHHRSADREGT